MLVPKHNQIVFVPIPNQNATVTFSGLDIRYHFLPPLGGANL